MEDLIRMFKAAVNAEVLRNSVESISTLVDEGKFKTDGSGISLGAVDPANVAMVTFSLSSDAFDSFEADESEIGMDITKLADILGMTSGTESVELELDEETQKMVITFSDLKYAISLLDPSTIRKEPSTPKLDLPASIVLNGAEFRRAIRAAEKISDHIALGVEGETFFMEAEGATDTVRLTLGKDQLLSLKPDDVRSLYSLDYLSDMSKPVSKASEVTIDLGKDYPLKISFAIADGNGSVEYLLAPRIESD